MHFVFPWIGWKCFPYRTVSVAKDLLIQKHETFRTQITTALLPKFYKIGKKTYFFTYDLCKHQFVFSLGYIALNKANTQQRKH